MDITTTLATDLSGILGLDLMSEEEQEQFLDSIGEVVFESAVLRFLSEVDDETQSVFAAWIQAHANDPKMIENLNKVYPNFKLILEEEVSNFRSDAMRLSGMNSAT